MVTEIADEEIEKAWEAIKFLSANPVARRLAEAQEMHRRDMVDRIEGGREEGRQEGRQKMLATASNMLQDKMEHAVIARWTGLSPGEINKLAAELGVGGF